MNRFSSPRFLCSVLTALLVVLILGCECGSNREKEALPSAAPAADGINPITAKGLSVLLDTSKGKVGIVNFWAIWCPPCVAELPELVKFYHTQSREDVALHAISLDAVEGLETIIKPFLESKNVTFPVHILVERDIEAVSKAVKAEISGALPITLIYDRQGNLVKLWEGGITLEELNQIVTPLL